MAKRFWGTAADSFVASMPVESKKAEFSPNCFTIGRFGDPVVGIDISLKQGVVDAPHVRVGKFFLKQDAVDGCDYVTSSDPVSATLQRVRLHRVQPFGKQAFYTLKRAEDRKSPTSVVKVDLNPTLNFGAAKVVARVELRLFTGTFGGTLIERDGQEQLIEIKEGEVFAVFYPDGGVRKFRRQGAKLEEKSLGTEEMLSLRVNEAWRQLDHEVERTQGARENVVCAILLGMVDLFHLTKRFDRRNLGQGMRIALMREFFLELSEEAMTLCQRKLTGVLHEVDPALLAMLREGAPKTATNAVVHSATVTDIADARDKKVQAEDGLTPEARDALRKQNIARDEAARVAKEARQAEFKAKRQAKQAAAAAQKPSKKHKNKGSDDERKRA